MSTKFRYYINGQWVEEDEPSDPYAEGLHIHVWTRYVGFRKIVDYCWCGEEQEVDWTNVGTDKKEDKNSR